MTFIKERKYYNYFHQNKIEIVGRKAKLGDI
jgi:hypothetical protein